MELQLSKRLQAVASFVPQNSIVADIGSDHAYLPVYLIQQDFVEKAVAGEVVQGPFESAVKTVKRHGVTNSITVRLASGLAAIKQSDCVDTVTIAGMGGSLITSILLEGEVQLQNVKRIIAQPNIHAQAIREWASKNGWGIIHEYILEEDDKIYEIVVLERGQSDCDELSLLLGPILMQERNDIFREKWTKEIMQWKEVLQSLERAKETKDTIEKKKELERRIHLVGEVLNN